MLPLGAAGLGHVYLQHNQRAQLLKALLLFNGGPRVIVINVPWYLAR